MRGREEKKGKGKVFNNALLCLENLPQHLKREGKKRQRGRKKISEGKGREYFKRSWERFSTMPCYVLKTFPSTMKNEGKGRKKGKGKKKDAQGREENIFKGAGEGFQQCYALKPSPAP